MQTCRFNIHNTLAACRAHATGLFNNKRHWVGFIHQAQFACFADFLVIKRIHEDAAACQDAVYFSHHGRDPAHIEIFLAAAFCLAFYALIDITLYRLFPVTLVGHIDRKFLRVCGNAHLGMSQHKFADIVVQCKSVYTVTRGDNQHGRRTVQRIAGTDLLIVQTDRLSAFDVILPDPVPGKGQVLTTLSNFWFQKLGNVIPNHLSGIAPEDVVRTDADRAQIKGRAFVVKRLKALPVEAIVRGYLVGSGWKEYKKTGSVCGIKLPAGLQEAQKLPQPLFTPSTKAAAGEHDENISFEQVAKLLGEARANEVSKASLALYGEAAEYAASKGIIIADTKFEFGEDETGKLYLIDEALTPDSSRFWPAEDYRVGSNPPSFDKQFVRDWLEASGWNKQPPAPKVPQEVLQKTADKYHEALRRLMAK